MMAMLPQDPQSLFAHAFVYSVKLNGWKNLLLNLCLLVLAVAYAGWYSSYNHFGVTNLVANYIGNQITLESVVYGAVQGVTMATVVMWLCCIFKLITADKVVYLFGRISPKLSLFLSILLRTVPRIKVRAKRIELSRQGIGRGIRQGTGDRLFLVFDGSADGSAVQLDYHPLRSRDRYEQDHSPFLRFLCRLCRISSAAHGAADGRGVPF